MATTDTSLSSQEAIKPSAKTLRAVVAEYLLSCGDQGATDEQMQREIPMSQNTQRPRRKELQEQGIAVATQERRKTSSGRNAIVWKHKKFTTPPGRLF